MPKKLRVIDLTMHLSGPYCCWLLASLGAEVIKVERPEGGDPVRATGPFVHGDSTYFGSVNRNKRSIAIDLKSERGKRIFSELVKTADVLVENFRAGVLTRLGFGDDKLKALNPNLIIASITGFGHSSPIAHRPAFDIVIQGMSGLMSLTGKPDGDATAAGVSIADITSGIFAALAVMSALLERERTGRVKRIDISMLHCQFALQENAMARYLNTDETPRRTGSRHPQVAPFQSYPTADGTIVVAADGEVNWRNFCTALGAHHLLDDERFATNDRRVEHHDELEGILLPIFRSRSSQEVLQELAHYDVPCGPVNTIPQALQAQYMDPARVISEVFHADGARLRYVASPVADGQQETVAPALGQHTEEILYELGLENVNH